MSSTFFKPLPAYLAKRYQGWKATTFDENKGWYQRLAEVGQHPRFMVIACCDSRVNINAIFGADSGEFFIHRNIANLVPPYKKDEEYHGTSAAIEYAVTGLKVSNIIVLGHSNCGGVQTILPHFSNPKNTDNNKTIFVGRWLEILRPGFERIPKLQEIEKNIKNLEKQTVVVSLENLLGFPFVSEALKSGTLSLHGLSYDIKSGELFFFDQETGNFNSV